MKIALKVLKYVLVSLGLLVLVAGGLFASTKIGKAPLAESLQLPGVEVIKDGFVAVSIVDLGEGAVALVDAGNDSDARPILAALKRRNLGPEAVQAILLTHGDFDHTAGARQFPKATVMALGPDVALAEGKVSRTPLLSAKPSGFQVGRTLADGEGVEIGGVRFEVFAVPGHTKGSAAFLARNALFVGDSAESTSGGKLEGGNWISNEDSKANAASLRALAARLAPRAAEVKAIVPAHSGVLQAGLAPLTEFAAASGR